MNLDPASQATKIGWWNHSWHIGNPAWTRDLAMTIEGGTTAALYPPEIRSRTGFTSGDVPP